MKIGSFVPQGWRMDLNGIPIEDQWKTIVSSAKNIELIKLISASINPKIFELLNKLNI